MATIDIFGAIDDECVSDVRRAIAQAPSSEGLHLRIASPGGQLGAGVTAYNVLRGAEQKVTAYMEGDAMSAASLLVCAADYVEMPSNTLLMVHDPWLPYMGALTIEESGRINNYLTATKGQALEIYNTKTGTPKNELSRLMHNETYFTADEALSEGFINNVVSESRTVQNRPIDDYTARDTEKLAQALAQRRIPRDIQSLLHSIGIE